MEDEEEYTGSLDPQGAQAMLGQLTQRYMGLDQREAQARQQVERSRAERLRQAQERIKAMRFGEPSRSQELFALSSAFLSPKPYRGIAGTMANLAPMLGSVARSRSDAEAQRAELLAKLEADYAAGRETLDLDAVERERKNLADLMRVYRPLARQPSTNRRLEVTTNPVSGVETYKNYAVPVRAVNALRYALSRPGVTDQQRADTISAFEREFNVSAAEFLEGSN